MLNGSDSAAVAASTRKDYFRVEVFDRRASDLARALERTRGNISHAAWRGAVQAARWQAEIPRWGRCGDWTNNCLEPNPGRRGWKSRLRAVRRLRCVRGRRPGPYPG